MIQGIAARQHPLEPSLQRWSRRLAAGLGAAGLALALMASGGCSGSGNGVSITGTARIGLTSYVYGALLDAPPTKNIHCDPVPSGSGTVRIQAGVEEVDRGSSLELVIDFEPESSRVSAVSLVAHQEGQDYTGDGCTGEVTSYLDSGSSFSATVACPSSNGGSDVALSLEADFRFCHLVAPR